MNAYLNHVVISWVQNKRFEYVSNIMSKRHRVFTESFNIFFFKIQKTKTYAELNMKDFRKSSFGDYIHVTFM